MTDTAHPYKYPSQTRERRHGPRGYKNYRDYRPWLEDEFSFRCAYCLKRMNWAPTDTWGVDHLMPQSVDPQQTCSYDNLVLTCQWCNYRKYAVSTIPDPIASPYGQSLRVNVRTGEIESIDEFGTALIRELKLNHPAQIRDRRRILQALAIFLRADYGEWLEWMGFPENLPDLRKKVPPEGNARPEGVRQSHHERRLRGELPEWYEE